MTQLKQTSLHSEHLKLGARMVDFAGWHMPVQYKGVIEEHESVRNGVGLFDVSHMGEIFVSGPKALEALQWLTSNDVSKLKKGQAHYSLLLNFEGGMVDDIIVYCIEPDQKYLVCVNASNAEKDFRWMKENNKAQAEITNESAKWSQIAIQGPNAVALTARLLGDEVKQIKYFEFKALENPLKTYLCSEKGPERPTAAKVVSPEPAVNQGAKAVTAPPQGSMVNDSILVSSTSVSSAIDVWYVARTGYTGEDGYEVFLPNDAAAPLWRELLEKGQDLGVAAIGLGARDTLRTEMKYSLYGNEITAVTSALEAGLGWVIKFQKGDFIGRSALESQRGHLKSKLVGFKMLDKGIPRHDYPLISFDNIQIGKVTSGTMSPTLKEPIGLGYVPQELSEVGKEFFVQIRGRNAKAVVVKTPFVNTKSSASSGS